MDREKIHAALNEHVVTVLRGIGFKGSLPHFRRNTGQQIDLISFQFDKHGGGFVVEVAVSPTEGVTMPWGEQIPPGKVLATHLYPGNRIRLGAVLEGDSWFRYDNRGSCTTRFADTAREVLPYLTGEASNHWAKGPFPHKKPA
jgi:hypothetical protein